MAALASSSSFRAALVDTVRLRSNNERTRREEAAPIAEARMYSACRTSRKSASSFGSRLTRSAAAKASKADRVRSSPRYRDTVAVSSSTATEERQRRKLGGMGVNSDGTKVLACSRSIGEGARRKEKPM